jgi:hypothetical protein
MKYIAKIKVTLNNNEVHNLEKGTNFNSNTKKSLIRIDMWKIFGSNTIKDIEIKFLENE